MRDSEIRHLQVNPEGVDWRPMSDINPTNPSPQGAHGTWVKVLRRPENGGGWTIITRHVPPPGKAIRIVARAASHEEVYRLRGGFQNAAGTERQEPGTYIFNPAGMLHGGLIREETVGLNFLHGDLDECLEYEFIDLEAKPEG
jgi:hypothetical protein